MIARTDDAKFEVETSSIARLVVLAMPSRSCDMVE